MTNSNLEDDATPNNNYSCPAIRRNISRRSALGLLGFGAAAAALTPTLLKTAQAQNQTQTQPSQPAPNQPSQIITREIPRTKEKLPAIGLGTFMTFDALSDQPRDHLQQVMRRFWDAGGRVVDTSLLYGMSEVNVGEFARTLGLTNNLFITNKTWATGEYLGDPSQAQRQFEQSLTRLSRDRIDVLQVHSLVNVDAILPLLKAWKEEGRIRYVGVTHHDPLYFAALERWIENGDLDFVQLRYSIRQRGVEDRILPAAAARGTAVLANMPFEKARLFELVEGQPLPDFASDFGCENWAQFFLKYVISHPALTCAIPATTNPDHVVENMGALRGSLPDDSMRIRMVEHMESLPGFDNLLQTPWYPGKNFNGLVRLPNPRPIG
ncbi:aldo/keto reductase [Leptolyngbya sp. FACHB-541]|uniref:aldo/keto reductase n=1 Tax=Leptolyngbya sp. FACHB-541 TaxID=2692810 RepID=UPI00168635B1|nr:aldo/keto reductase [Leptolyngbya sp. FACHB-541]MBD1996270.1 aldo/keto reductase [Leptolyngbya sp. FACHB-541]